MLCSFYFNLIVPYTLEFGDNIMYIEQYVHICPQWCSDCCCTLQTSALCECVKLKGENHDLRLNGPTAVWPVLSCLPESPQTRSERRVVK